MISSSLRETKNLSYCLTSLLFVPAKRCVPSEFLEIALSFQDPLTVSCVLSSRCVRRPTTARGLNSLPRLCGSPYPR